jgi:hypothetical protein
MSLFNEALGYGQHIAHLRRPILTRLTHCSVPLDLHSCGSDLIYEYFYIII